MISLLALFLFLVLSSAFFSSSETALFSLSQVQIHRIKETGSWSSQRLMELLKFPRKALVTILFGNELVNISISIVGAAMIHRIFDLGVRLETLLAVLIITPIIMVVCEITPKSVALRFAEQMALSFAFPISVFSKLIAPLRIVLTWIARRMVILFGGSMSVETPMMMEDEYRRLVDLGRREGAIEEEEREIIHNVFEFTDKRVGEIMTPSERLFSLDIEIPHEKLMAEMRSTQFSRVPIYEGRRSNIVGILHVRNLFKYQMRRSAGEAVDLRSLLGKPLFVDERTPLEDLLKEFQRTQMHMALVMNADGDLVGIVTMDDVQEELFGEIEE